MGAVDGVQLLRRVYRLFEVNASVDHCVGKGEGLYKSKHKATWKTFQKRKVDYDIIYSRQVIGIKDLSLDPTTGYEHIHFHSIEKDDSNKYKLEVYSSMFKQQFQESKPAVCVFRMQVKQICDNFAL